MCESLTIELFELMILGITEQMCTTIDNNIFLRVANVFQRKLNFEFV